MIRAFLARLVALLVVASIAAQPCLSFQTPLSEESVREAYFLGRRHDGSLLTFLDKYNKHLPPPKTGPYISNITFSTPFAQFVLLCNQYSGDYNAQQAESDHRGQKEFVEVRIEIQLTPSYSAFLNPQAGSQSGSSAALIPRPGDFWKDFEVRIFDGERTISPTASHGHANYNCGRWHRGPCGPTGATLEFEFPAESFTSDSATIQVAPPEGEAVSVDFNVASLR